MYLSESVWDELLLEGVRPIDPRMCCLVEVEEQIYGELCREFHESIAHLDPSSSREDHEEYWYQLEQCAPDDCDVVGELLVALNDPSWVTPSLVL